MRNICDDRLTYVFGDGDYKLNENLSLGTKIRKENVFYGPIRLYKNQDNQVLFVEKEPNGEEKMMIFEDDTLTWKEKTLLIRVREFGYVDVEEIKTFSDRIRIRKDLCGKGFFLNGLIMTTFPNEPEDMFINVDELTPVENIPDKVSIKQLRKLNFNK